MPAQVLWSEGMLLTPQHFQLSDSQRFLDQWGRIRAVSGPCVGVQEIEFDLVELSSGHVSLKKISAVFADGTWVNAPKDDLLPASRPAPGGVDRPVRVMLGLPNQVDGGLSAGAAPQSGRFQLEEWKVDDQNAPRRSRRVEVARPVMRLVFDGEPTEGLVILKLAELVRDGSGRWQLSSRYIPPVLQLMAWPGLKKLVDDVHVQLVSCRRRLIERRGQGVPVELTYTEMLSFWFLFALNGVIASVEHVLDTPDLPPERVFQALRSGAGQMITFVDGMAPMDLPSFKGDDLYGSFQGMADAIRRCLDVMLPVHHVQVAMRQHGAHVWRAELPRDVALDKADHVLVLAGVLPDGTGREDVRDAIKVAASGDIEFIVGAALRGLDLQVLARPPAGVPVRREAIYLRLRRTAPFWEPIAQSHDLAVYLPGKLVALTPELVIVP